MSILPAKMHDKDPAVGSRVLASHFLTEAALLHNGFIQYCLVRNADVPYPDFQQH